MFHPSKTQSKKVFHVSTFRPEKCGIAYWTEDKINYLHMAHPTTRNRVIAVNGFRSVSDYGDMVDFAFERNDLGDYVKAAEFVNKDPDAKAVWIEHEFGIFGGMVNPPVSLRENLPVGNYLLNFLDNLDRPTGITCHTVLKDAHKNKDATARRDVFRQIVKRVNHVVAISSTARDILVGEYGVDSKKVTTIYHGTHDFAENQEHAKKVLGLEGRFVISTVGLVRKKRGMEHVIRALPRVVEDHPEIVYVIAGATHPKEKVDGREPYREELEKEVQRQGLQKNVVFVNKELPQNSLLRHIAASDIAVTPYGDPRQVSSGVLSYCVGLGVPVISTPFLYAEEVLGEGRGVVLSDFGNSDSISNAIRSLLENPERIFKMKENMAPIQDSMRWQNVAKVYHRLQEQIIG